MTNVDLFEELARPGPVDGDEPRQNELPIPAAGTRARQQRPAAFASPVAGDGAGDGRHYRLAMRAARRLPRSDRRVQTRRLICHHLRCMLDEDQTSGGSSRRRGALAT